MLAVLIRFNDDSYWATLDAMLCVCPFMFNAPVLAEHISEQGSNTKL